VSPPVVVIGASSGGVEALVKLVGGLTDAAIGCGGATAADEAELTP
jgi:hypothetical protein